MKNIFILSVFAILFFTANTTQAQDYFKERRYEGIDFTKSKVKKQYITISRKKYEVVSKEEEVMLGKKLSYDTKQKVFYVKRQKKAMTFRETTNYMKYVGNKQSADELRKAMNYYYADAGLKVGGFIVGTVGFFMSLSEFSDTDAAPVKGLAVIGIGGLMYAGGYLFEMKGDDTVKKTIRYHNKKVRQFSTPVVTKNDFVPSNLGFKSVCTNLLNPTPIPALSLTWNF